jgi:hypothetical protein
MSAVVSNEVGNNQQRSGVVLAVSRSIYFTVAVLALLASAPAYAVTFTVNSVTASPSSLQPGQTVQFATTVTASAAASDYTIGLQVFLNGTFIGWPISQLFQGINFQPGVGVYRTIQLDDTGRHHPRKL